MATEEKNGRARIDPVPVSKLRETALSGEYDPGVDRLLEGELEYIQRKREGAHRADLAGLALSGGGIRSATFALGVMQALAKEGVLNRMDYLSTVSGGGYIGSALTWFLGPQNKTAEFGLKESNFPWGIDAGGKSEPLQRKMLDWLRQHGKYLTPGKGITLMSGIAVVLRGIILNLIVWVPLGALAFLWLFAAGDVTAAIFGGWFGLVDLFRSCLEVLSGTPNSPATNLILVSLSASTAIAAALVLGSVIYALFTWFCTVPGRARYIFRRLAEAVSGYSLWVIVGLVALASIPLAGSAMDNWIAAAGGPVAALAGIAAGLWQFLRSLRETAAKLSFGLVAQAGALLLLYGFGLTCFAIAAHVAGLPPDTDVWYFEAAVWVAIVTGVFCSLNYISIHRFYRDRLMETFLPDRERVEGGDAGPAYVADGKELAGILDRDNESKPVAPYHLINTNVILVNSAEPRRRLRGGDSFIMGPDYCGSSATGWIRTRSVIKGRLSLATAMAISGAAANPNVGSGGIGVTRSRLVSLLMALLGLRLGYWLPNPQKPFCRWLRPNHFLPGLTQAFARHKESACFIEVSDGGHFENLALYELIRRRLKLIIVCDGACDPKFGFSDLNSLRRRIAADFEARIEFEEGHEPEKLIPKRLKEAAPDGAGYAVDADMAEQGFLLGRIEYALTPEERKKKAEKKTYRQDTGALVYIKTTMVESLSFGVKAYKGAHHDFPDETTADQFFDEEQFDAYRELGRHLGLKMLEQTKLADKIDQVIENGAWSIPAP